MKYGQKKCIRKERCLVGDVLQDRTEFHRCKRNRDGLSTTCKTCVRTQRKEYEDRLDPSVIEEWKRRKKERMKLSKYKRRAVISSTRSRKRKNKRDSQR